MKSSVLRLSRSPSPSRILGCVQFLYLILFLPFQSKPRPRPGDLIEIFRIGYEHWAIYVEDDSPPPALVSLLFPPVLGCSASFIMSVFSSRALVKYSRLEDVLHGCSWKVNNKLDGTYLPLPVDKIIQRTKKMINKIVQYSLIDGNCEHFVNDLRYGVSRSQQVGHLGSAMASGSRLRTGRFLKGRGEV
uniref:Phospholipase A and acyltransferase 5 n=1 Tax=Suricata suricatta TaxID=37032 RepID=A0A673VPJ9_SURSU